VRALIAALLLAGTPLAAQETVQRLLELPAHRSLMAKVAEGPLAPFTTDGCSGGLSTSWEVVADLFPNFAGAHAETPPWEACCVTHDRAYHAAGGAREAEASFVARRDADAALRACVIAEGAGRRAALAARYDVPPERIAQAYRAIAESMYTAVRFGGGPCSGLPWRWGYGYPNCLPVSLD
jgi:hypothetical protein